MTLPLPDVVQASRLRGFVRLCRVPACLKLHGTHIAQRRLPSPVAVERPPVDHFVHRFALGGEPFSVQPPHLQAAPQTLRGRIVPAVALATHRTSHSVAFQRGLGGVAAVLAASVSLWKISPGCGLRLNHAMRSASVAEFVCMCGCMNHSTTCQLNRSITAARYSHPSSVAMQVMLLLHTRSGASGLNSRPAGSAPSADCADCRW